MRDMAIHMMRSIGDFAGGCNVSLRLVQMKKKILLPLKLIQEYHDLRHWQVKQQDILLQKLLLNWPLVIHLDELDNQITKSTSALFEPTLDYVIVKIPRWNFDKFEGVDQNFRTSNESCWRSYGNWTFLSRSIA